MIAKMRIFSLIKFEAWKFVSSSVIEVEIRMINFIKCLPIFVIFTSKVHGWNSWERRVDSRCPPGVSNPPVMLNDPQDCTRFFKCQGGIAFPISCPKGQNWNARANHCDWPK